MKLLLVVALAMAVSASASKITTEQATDIVANTPVEKAAEAVVDLGEYTPPRENRSNKRALSISLPSALALSYRVVYSRPRSFLDSPVSRVRAISNSVRRFPILFSLDPLPSPIACSKTGSKRAPC